MTPLRTRIERLEAKRGIKNDRAPSIVIFNKIWREGGELCSTPVSANVRTTKGWEYITRDEGDVDFITRLKQVTARQKGNN
jgi:hypothetical protein